MYTEAQLIDFANFILTSRKGKRIKPNYKTEISDAELTNWKEKEEKK